MPDERQTNSERLRTLADLAEVEAADHPVRFARKLREIADSLDTEPEAGYPRRDGDVTVLGPECFTDGEVISYRGENYVRQSEARDNYQRVVREYGDNMHALRQRHDEAVAALREILELTDEPYGYGNVGSHNPIRDIARATLDRIEQGEER